MTPKLLNLYIARQFIGTLARITAGFAVIIFLADYVEVLRRYSNADSFTSLLGLQLATMRVPILLDTALPFVFLFATLVSLIVLSRKLELVVARASGVSVWGFLRAPFFIAVLFGTAGTMFLNPAAVDLKEKAELMEASLGSSAARNTGSWFRQESDTGPSIVYAGAASEDGLALFGVTAFVFGAAGEFREKIVAPRADHTANHWILADALVVPAQSAPYPSERYELPTELTAAELSRTFIDPEAISVWSLPGFIDTAARTGVDPDRLRVTFHSLLSRPFFLLAMVVIAATVSLRLSRHGGTWRLVLTGAALGFLLYAVTEIVSDLGGNGIIDPVLAAWLPPIVGLTFGATILLYQEDG